MPKNGSQKKSRRAAARERMYHDLVFEAAEHVFARKGFEEATMQDVAAEAGISLKTLYATFPGKSDLYAEIQGVRAREFLQFTTASIGDAQTALERLERGVRGYVDFLLAHEDFLRIHLREGKAWGLGASQAGIEGWKGGVAVFSDTLRQGVEEGIFHDGDLDMMAAAGIAVMQVHLARIATRPAGTRPETLAEEILVLLRRMYCKPDYRAAEAAA